MTMPAHHARAPAGFRSPAGRRWRLVAPLLLALAGAVRAQTVVLDTFDAAGGTGAVRPGTSWVGNVTQNATSITVAGGARSDNGWGAIGQSVDASALNYVTLVAQRDTGHTAPALVLQLEDLELDTLIITIDASLFALGALTNVTVPFPVPPTAFNIARITGWSLGGGTTGLTDFRMTFGNLALSATPPPANHSADSDRNYRISLFELTRVIELFNTRQGTGRTGCYQPDAAGEDGFAPDPARSASAVVTLASYHSADTDRNGKLGLFELTRVIELFNSRVGTTRTGNYHVLSGTEDGFAPGP